MLLRSMADLIPFRQGSEPNPRRGVSVPVVNVLTYPACEYWGNSTCQRVSLSWPPTAFPEVSSIALKRTAQSADESTTSHVGRRSSLVRRGT
jgi:hypothetical protein